MDSASLAFSVAQTLFATLECTELKQLFSLFGYKFELEKLEKTVKTIKSVLQDADAKRELNQQEQDWVDNLTDFVYDADDLLDEFATVAAQEKQRLIEKHGGFSEKVGRLFSRFKKLFDAYKMPRVVKKIRETLDGIANDANKFSFRVDNKPLRRRREETCSYVYQSDIIGREDDMDRVVHKLLEFDIERHVSVLTIMGMGGLGKTTLAQLVFNDERVAKEFSLRLWVCVSDEGQQQLDVVSILRSIIKSATTEREIDELGEEQLQRKLQEKLNGNKYLLVLDDVWTEKNWEWLKLEKYLKAGQRGSRILVTTRSKETAIAVGSNEELTYELLGLSDGNSWRLFEVTVGQQQANRLDLVEMGQAIVKKCANIPLAIKVIGALLHGQHEDKWRSFQNSSLFEIRKNENDIMHILKFSYHHLIPALKSCFSYCAIFPKDFVIKKEMLISLWLAQGYVETLDGGQSIEDAAAEYFRILVRRCFFQDVRKDVYGEVVSCKIHDLMHDVAQGVARREITGVNFTSMSNLNKKIRHISEASRSSTEGLFIKSKLRTYFLDHVYEKSTQSVHHFPVCKLLANLMCLRALDLSHLEIQSLPDAIGRLLHLRYLDLSSNRKLEVIPKSITKLLNLQTLCLAGCSKLRELPKHSSRLASLRVLDISGCKGLTYMPSGMKKLTGLCKLPMFIVRGRSSSSKQDFGELEDLGALTKLKGSLTIKINEDYRYEKEEHGEGARYLSNKEHVYEISIEWESGEDYEGRVKEQEALLENLQPHCNLRELSMIGYKGERIPRWPIEDKLATSLPNLVNITLGSCEELQELPWLSKLCCLKSLELSDLKKLEYMENGRGGEIESSSLLFFLSLEKLKLEELPKLKGWWVRCGSGVLPAFPRLSKLIIQNCPELTSIPPCPNLEGLTSWGRVNERLRIKLKKEDENKGGDVSISMGSYKYSSAMSSSLMHRGNLRHDTKLKRVWVHGNVGNLKSLPIQAFSCVTELVIRDDKEVESLPEGDGGVVEEVFRSCSSSLRYLEIRRCSNLRRVLSGGGGWEHLTALESLTLSDLGRLRFVDEDDMPWRSLGQSLRSLKLQFLDKMVKLPKGMRHLISLQSLSITWCPLDEVPEWIGSGCFSSLQSLKMDHCTQIKSLPDAMRNMTSLTTLDISGCTEALKERCRAQNPQGEDWPKIHHIPTIRTELNIIQMYFC